jgi:hypothetical protein
MLEVYAEVLAEQGLDAQKLDAESVRAGALGQAG